MSHFKYRIESIEELPELAAKLLNDSLRCKVWLLNAEMGAGKTTLIKQLCAELGVIDVVQSPTYGLVNEYETKQGSKVYHFDLYRLEDERELLSLGLEEYFFSGHFCFIEWPNVAEAVLPQEYCQIRISVISERAREVELRLSLP